MSQDNGVESSRAHLLSQEHQNHLYLQNNHWWKRPGPIGEKCTAKDTKQGLHWWLTNKESTSNSGATNLGSTPGARRSPGGWHGNPLQYSCLENPMHREAWRDTV